MRLRRRRAARDPTPGMSISSSSSTLLLMARRTGWSHPSSHKRRRPSRLGSSSQPPSPRGAASPGRSRQKEVLAERESGSGGLGEPRRLGPSAFIRLAAGGRKLHARVCLRRGHGTDRPRRSTHARREGAWSCLVCCVRHPARAGVRQLRRLGPLRRSRRRWRGVDQPEPQPKPDAGWLDHERRRTKRTVHRSE